MRQRKYNYTEILPVVDSNLNFLIFQKYEDSKIEVLYLNLTKKPVPQN